jgi:hypothetical protein
MDSKHATSYLSVLRRDLLRPAAVLPGTRLARTSASPAAVPLRCEHVDLASRPGIRIASLFSGATPTVFHRGLFIVSASRVHRRRAFFDVSDHACNIIVSSSFHPIFSLLVFVL